MDLYTDGEIGNIIKKMRVYKNLTQGELGEKLGVQAAAVQKWESGKVTNIKRSMLQKLAVELNISPAVLIGFKSVDLAYLRHLDEVDNFVKKLESE